MESSKRDLLLEEYEDSYTILTADGFDDAILGFCENSERVIYSVSKCIDILIAGGMSEEDALEYFSFNVSGAYVGENTPIWCFDYFITLNE
jgi:hypothetical protein